MQAVIDSMLKNGNPMLGKVTDLPAVRTASIASQLSMLVYDEVVQGQQYDLSIPGADARHHNDRAL